MDDIKDAFEIARLLEHEIKEPSSDDSYDNSLNVELEFRFRSVDRNKFLRLYDYASVHFRKIGEYEYTESRIHTINSVHREIVRPDGQRTIQSKTQIKASNITDMWVSISVSLEKDMSTTKRKLARLKSKLRTSFEIVSEKFRLDMTKIYEDDSYQIELEVLDIFQEPEESMHIINSLLMKMLDTPLYLKKTLHDCVLNIASTKYYFSEKAYFCIKERKYQIPISMKIEHFSSLFTRRFYITPKLDGERRFLILFNNNCYSVDSLLQPRKEHGSIPYDNSAPCILDCEYVNGYYNIIDVVILYGKYIGNNKNPIDRLEDFREKYIADDSIMNIKTYYVFTSRMYDTILSWKDIHDMDGVILVSDMYIGRCMKVKFNITVDLYFDEENDLISSDHMILPKDIEIRGKEALVAGKVYEFIVVSKTILSILRVRDDKPFPNSSNVINTNMSSDVATMDIFRGKHSIMMRKMHNNVKKLMYKMSNTNNSVILDIGTGQGGDLSKWRKAKIVFAIEPDENASDELSRRLFQHSKKVNICHIQCRTSSHIYINKTIGNKKADIISLFFCLNLFTEDDLNGMYKIISRCASKECKIIGIYMGNISSGSNSCFDIKDHNDGTYSVELHGTRINQMERILDFHKMKSMLEGLGFTLMFRSRINKMNDNLSNEEILLTNMFYAFEFRRGNKAWTRKRSRSIKISNKNAGRIVIDNEYKVLDIFGPRYGDESYYFERDGIVLQHIATSEEVQMARIRYSSI